MSIKIPTLLAKIKFLPNRENATIILDFYKYIQDKDSSENHIINNIKVILDLAGFLGPVRYQDIKKRANPIVSEFKNQGLHTRFRKKMDDDLESLPEQNKAILQMIL
jgi:hypothetical protein